MISLIIDVQQIVHTAFGKGVIRDFEFLLLPVNNDGRSINTCELADSICTTTSVVIFVVAVNFTTELILDV